jgi:hypothetical protein
MTTFLGVIDMPFTIVYNGEKTPCGSIDELESSLLKQASKCKILDYHASVRYQTSSGMTRNQFISIGKDKKIKYTYKNNEKIDFSLWEDELTCKA